MSALFPIRESKKRVPVRERRITRCIPTGAPRLMESSVERQVRANAEAWTALVDVLRRSTTARLELLKAHAGRDRISCPWGRLVICDGGCRCGGAAMVTVTFLREHYEHLVAEVVKIATPTSARRRGSQ